MRTHFSTRWVILAVISSALFLLVIDMTVLYTALPALTYELKASSSEKLWIVNAYALVVSGLLLGMGTLGDRIGHKRLFIAGLAVFGVASVCAAFSPSPGYLIAARALLAIGAAMAMPATLSIIRHTFTDQQERSLAIGIWAAVASGGAAFGPVIGGVLLEYFWWGSVFLINVPIVLIAIPLALLLIPARPGNVERRWDPVGSLLLMIGLIGLCYAVKELGKRASSLDAALLAFVVGVVFLVLFVYQQRRRAQPMIDFLIFRHHGFLTAVLSALVAAAALIGMELVFSQRLQLVLGLSALEAGLFILPLPVASLIAGPLTGHLLARIGSQRALTWALLISGLGMGAFLFLHSASVMAQIASLLVLGAGLGATMTAASSTIMHSVPVEQAGTAAAVEEMSFELGGAIGVTLMGSLSSAVYTASMVLPAELSAPLAVRDGLDQALLAAEAMLPDSGAILVHLGQRAFDHGFFVVLAASTGLLLLAAAIAGMSANGRRATKSLTKWY